MTRDEKPLRLTTRRRNHAAGASRRIAFGLSAATAAFLASLMAEGRAEPAAAPEPLTTTTTAPEPLIVHVRVTRPWAAQAGTGPRPGTRPPAVAAPAPPRAAQPAPAPVVTAAPPTAPPTTATRAS